MLRACFGSPPKEQRILHVQRSCFASGLKIIFFISRELTSGESDRLLPGRTVSIGSDRVCLPTSSTRPFLLLASYFRYHWSSALRPFPVPIAIWFDRPLGEVTPNSRQIVDEVALIQVVRKYTKISWHRNMILSAFWHYLRITELFTTFLLNNLSRLMKI